jgi:hypothetical protein
VFVDEDGEEYEEFSDDEYGDDAVEGDEIDAEAFDALAEEYADEELGDLEGCEDTDGLVDFEGNELFDAALDEFLQVSITFLSMKHYQ